MKAFTPTLLAMGAALALSGCGTLAPTYERPASPVAADWAPVGSDTAVSGSGTSSTAAADLGWRAFFADAEEEVAGAKTVVRVAVELDEEFGNRHDDADLRGDGDDQ